SIMDTISTAYVGESVSISSNAARANGDNGWLRAKSACSSTVSSNRLPHASGLSLTTTTSVTSSSRKIPMARRCNCALAALVSADRWTIRRTDVMGFPGRARMFNRIECVMRIRETMGSGWATTNLSKVLLDQETKPLGGDFLGWDLVDWAIRRARSSSFLILENFSAAF